MATIVYQASDTDAGTIAGGAAYTFALTVASALGQERLVAVAAVRDSAGGFTSVTIDGQLAMQVGATVVGGGADPCVLEFWRAPGTAGTTINVVATNSSGASPNMFQGYCSLWTLNNCMALFATASSTVNDPTLSLNTASSGVAAAAVVGYSAASPAAAWTGLTERFDARIFSDDVFSTASNDIAVGQTPRVVSVNITPDLTGGSVAAMSVSFLPKALSAPVMLGGLVDEDGWFEELTTVTSWHGQLDIRSWFDPDLVAEAAAAGDIDGTFAVTIDPVTLAASADLLIQGSLAQTIAAVTLSASADLLVQGTFAQTIAPVTLAATGKVIISGTFAQTIDPITLSAAGDVDISATFGVTVDPVTLAASGDVDISGSFSQTIDPVTLSASADLLIQGTFGVTIDPVTLVASGTASDVISGTFSQTVDPITLSASADLLVQGTFSQTIAAITLSASADLLVQGTFGVTIDPVTLAASGTASDVITGTFAVTIDPVTLSASADLLVQGTFAQTIDPVTLAATGTVSGGAISGTFSRTIDPVTLAATATISQPAVVGIPDTGGGGGGPRWHRRRNINEDPDAFADLFEEWRERRKAPKPDIPETISGVPKAASVVSEKDTHREATERLVERDEAEELQRRLQAVEAAYDRAMAAYEAILVRMDAAKAANARRAAEKQEEQARQQAIQVAIELELAWLAWEAFLDEEDEMLLLAA